jgi:hypothetical protein
LWSPGKLYYCSGWLKENGPDKIVGAVLVLR